MLCDVNDRQRTLGSAGRVFIEIKKDTGRIAKAGKKIDFGRIGFGQDVVAAGMLVDKLVQFLILARGHSRDTQATCARNGKPNRLCVRRIFVAQVVNEPRRHLEHGVKKAEAHHAGHT